jgi:hypothetical protein
VLDTYGFQVKQVPDIHCDFKPKTELMGWVERECADEDQLGGRQSNLRGKTELIITHAVPIIFHELLLAFVVVSQVASLFGLKSAQLYPIYANERWRFKKTPAFRGKTWQFSAQFCPLGTVVYMAIAYMLKTVQG